MTTTRDKQDARVQLEFVANIKQITNGVQDADHSPLNLTFTNPQRSAEYGVGMATHLLTAYFNDWSAVDEWLNLLNDAALDVLNDETEDHS